MKRLLTDSQIIAIREQRQSKQTWQRTGKPLRFLASEYGVSVSYVSRLCNHKSRSSLDPNR